MNNQLGLPQIMIQSCHWFEGTSVQNIRSQSGGGGWRTGLNQRDYLMIAYA